MTNGMQTVTVFGREYAISLPDFDKREDLALSWHTAAGAADGAALRRIAAAALGLCTPIGKRAGVAWEAHGCNVLAYGGKVYSWLREQKATIPDIVEQGGKAVAACADSVFPREAEVETRSGFSAAPGGDSTS